MKTNSIIRRFLLIAVFLAGSGWITQVSARADYVIDLNTRTVTSLGTVGGKALWARAINDAGQVAGWTRPIGRGERAFITGPNGVGVTDLGVMEGDFSHAYGINNAGQVAGWSYNAEISPHAFITGPDGVGMRDLGTLDGGNSYAYGINDAGQVVASLMGALSSLVLMA